MLLETLRRPHIVVVGLSPARFRLPKAGDACGGVIVRILWKGCEIQTGGRKGELMSAFETAAIMLMIAQLLATLISIRD